MQANPNETFKSLASNTWALSGNLAVFYIPSDDPEVIQNIVLSLEDLLKPGEGDAHLPVSASEVTVYTTVVRYTTHVDKVDRALANISDHYGLPGVLWFTGNANFARPEVNV